MPGVILVGVIGIITALDVEEIAEALEKIVVGKGLRVLFGVAAQEFTLLHFGVKSLVSDHEELYKKLVISRAKS